MTDKNKMLRQLPKVDELIHVMREGGWSGVPEIIIKTAVRKEIDTVRQRILSEHDYQFSSVDLLRRIHAEIEAASRPHLRKVINATGIVLHTNLGRARLSKAVSEQLAALGGGYSNLEYNLENGERGSRYEHVEGLLTMLTGAEAALVVNNNAAAVYLILDSVAKGQEVIVSRGELVEIGGSFRVPEIMQASGCRLVEVGTTNKTHRFDYEAQLNEHTGALLKVHTSNYKIIGFTEDVSLQELREVADSRGLPVIYDMGAGLLADLQAFGFGGEPTVRQCLEEQADLVCFSGDKLLGGPQAGIIVGKAKYIQQMKKNHLLRALRIDKLTLAALELTLRQYLSPEDALKQIPTLRMLTTGAADLKAKAEQLYAMLVPSQGRNYEVIPIESQVGGGSMPGLSLPSFGVAAAIDGISADRLEQMLRASSIPVIGRIVKDRVVLDVRTIESDELNVVAACFNKFHVKGDTQ